MPKNQPQLRLLLPHDATILPDFATGFEGCTLYSEGRERIARAASELTLAGSVFWGDSEIDFYHITHGGSVNLPDPVEDVYNVVSKLTILAALRDERPVDDLLFLFDDVRTETEFLGVRGLGQIMPVRHPQVPLDLPSGSMSYELRNACPYPAKRYHQNTPKYVPHDYPPRSTLPISPPAKQRSVLYNTSYNAALSKRLRIPVYRTRAAGVKNDCLQPGLPDVLRIVNPNVIVALGAAAVDRGYVMLTREVRNERGGMLGGEAVGMPDQSVLCGFRV
jgi:hypothetical protein